MADRQVGLAKRLLNLMPPMELVAVAGLVGCLMVAGWANYERSATRSRLSQVRSDFALMRRGLQAYFADNLAYPVHTWPCPPHEDQIDGTLAGETLTHGMTTPIAYLQSLPVDPFLDAPGLPLSPRLYRYGNPDYFRKLYNEGSICDQDFDFAWAPGSFAEIDSFEYYFGRYFLMSAGPDRALDPGDYTSDNVWSSAFQTYDATNGAVSWGNIVMSEIMIEPRYVPINAFPGRSSGK